MGLESRMDLKTMVTVLGGNPQGIERDLVVFEICLPEYMEQSARL